MKKILLVILALISACLVSGQKVDFFKGNWQEANEQAALQDKYIFLDAYTEWCGWCKVMEKEMFTDPAIAPFINEHFIPVQVDFEDSVGSKLAMKFRVWGYPTTLVFNVHGQLIDKFSGYTYDHGNYLDFLKNSLAVKEERVFDYDSHELDLPYPEFFLQANSPGKGRKWPKDSVVTAYLDGQDDLFSEVNWSILYRMQPRSYEDFVVQNIQVYGDKYGKKEASDFLESAVFRCLDKAIDSADLSSFKKALELCSKTQDPETTRINVELYYYGEIKDWHGYVSALASLIEKKGYSAHMAINNSCWKLYEEAEDPAVLKQAVDWMGTVVGENPTWMYLDTYTALLYKTGNLEEALKYADLAIEAGEKEKQEDISSTKELKKKIEEALR